MRFWFCFFYLCFVGAASFILGRLLPKTWFDPCGFPFKSVPFEKNGSLYDKVGVRFWQTKVPDMSRIFRKLMPPKSLTGDIKARLPELLRETCVAELIHFLNCFAGLYCLRICRRSPISEHIYPCLTCKPGPIFNLFNIKGSLVYAT